MQNNLHITSQLPVTLNNYTKSRVIYVNNKPMPSVYETTDAKRFKKYFKKLLEGTIANSNWNNDEEHRDKFYIVEATWYFEKQNRDSNNMWKIMLDAVTETGLIWTDDRQVIERTSRIYYDTANPRVEIDVREAEWIGIFDTPSHLDDFMMNNCDRCSKDISHCSILNGALESRITEDINMEDWTCNKFKPLKEKKVKKVKEA